MNPRRRVLIAVVPMVLLGPILSGFVHELGHATVVWAVGGRLREFQPFWFLGSPHLHFEAHLDRSGHALMAVSGVAAVVMTSWVALAWIPFARLSSVAVLALSIPLPCLFTQLLAWVVLPWLWMLGFRPRDDVTVFLQTTGWHPLLVAAVSALLLGLTCGWFLRKTQVVSRLKALRAQALESREPAFPVTETRTQGSAGDAS